MTHASGGSRAGVPDPAAAGALSRLDEALSTLSDARRRVAELVLADPAEAGRSTITRLAERAGTNPATVTRLTADLGYPGFQAFRAAIARDAGRRAQAGWESDIGTEIGPGDDAAAVLDVLARDQYLAMSSTRAHLDLDAVDRLAAAIVAAPAVRVYGEWGDAIVARELHQRLARVGLTAWHVEGAQAADAAVRVTRSGEVALAVSRVGDDDTARDFLRASREHGALAAALVGDPSSPVAEAADVVLFSGTRAGPHWTDFFAGRASDSLTAAVLWVRVVQRLPGAFGGD